MRPQRVLVVAPQPFYEDRGTPIAVRHTLRALSELGYEADVLTFPVGDSPAIPGVRYLRVANWLRLRRVPIGLSLRKLWFDLFLYVALRRQLRRHSYACLHAVEEAAFLAVLAARQQQLPVIYDMQSSMVEQLCQQQFWRLPPLRWLATACEQWLLSRVDQVICSVGLAAYVRAVAPQARVREWRYPGATEVRIAPADAAAARERFQIPGDRPVVMYAGNCQAYQGVTHLVEAIIMVHARLPETHFVLVGAEAREAEALRAYLEGWVPPQRYQLLPRVSQQDAAALLSLADLVVSPRSAGGNLPLKIVDYLAAGRAIVATDIPAHRALLSEDIARLAQPSAVGLAMAIVELLQQPEQIRRLQQAAATYARTRLGWVQFAQSVGELYDAVARPSPTNGSSKSQSVSVVIPARNAAPMIGEVVRLVRAQQWPGLALELIVVDDGSTDATGEAARAAGARVISAAATDGGNPAAARNAGAAQAQGDVVVFLDADCTPAAEWLRAMLSRMAEGRVCVGGSLALPPGLSASARWDYYCGWYHVHPQRRPGWVVSHPPCNLGIRRELFLQSGGFNERHPVAYAHEELAWQAALQRTGQRIFFEPAAVAYHWNRPGVGQLLQRNYRWGYSAIESKAESGAARLRWLYRWPRLLALLSVPLAPLHALYLIACWLRAGILEPLLVFPIVLAARLSYGLGMMVGGWRWAGRRQAAQLQAPPPSEPGGVCAVICTRNRPQLLTRALASLCEQEASPEEILVVDNAPSADATREVVARHFPQARYVCEPVQGLDAARNRALRETRQPLVAFLDDDAVADRGWCGALRAALDASPSVAVCTGRVEPLSLDSAAQRLCEANGGFSRGAARIRLPRDAAQRLRGWPAPRIAWAVSIGNGCSMAVRRDAALALGGFDPALDLGEVLPGGGDLDLFWRALAAGYEMVYEPSALAWHEHRKDHDALIRQLAGHQRALVACLCKAAFQGPARLPVIGFLIWRLLKPGARLLRRLAGREPLPARALTMMWAGAWSGLWAYPAARRVARARLAAQGGYPPDVAASPAGVGVL